MHGNAIASQFRFLCEQSVEFTGNHKRNEKGRTILGKNSKKICSLELRFKRKENKICRNLLISFVNLRKWLRCQFKSYTSDKRSSQENS